MLIILQREIRQKIKALVHDTTLNPLTCDGNLAVFIEKTNPQKNVEPGCAGIASQICASPPSLSHSFKPPDLSSQISFTP